MREPTSMDECIYFTNRTVKDSRIKAWVFKQKCPQCGNSIMSKPKDPKTGKVSVRAKEYTCESCGFTQEKNEYESSLNINVKYTCPYCKHEDYTKVPFKRKKVKYFDEDEQKEKQADAVRFQCSKCSKNIDITKRMKE